MRFFLPPLAEGDPLAEETYQAIRKFIRKTMGSLDDRRFYSITYMHEGRTLHATVGKQDLLEREVVVAIFKSASPDLFYVCTDSRGAFFGVPIMTGSIKGLPTEFDP